MTRRDETRDQAVRVALAARLEQGDHRGGARVLAEAYGNRLHRFLWRFFADRRDAEDVAQEVWVGVLRALASYRFEAAPLTWLFRIAIHKVADQRRRHHAVVPLDSVVLGQVEAAGAARSSIARARPDRAHSLQQRQTRAAAALARFSDRDRQVAMLFLQGGLTAREVAEVSNVTEVNARQIKKNVIDALRAAIAEENPRAGRNRDDVR